MMKYLCPFCENEFNIDTDDTLAICPRCNRSIGSEPLEIHIGQRIGSYEVKELLGSGGMGDVYLARQDKVERMVAIKVLQPALAENKTYLERFFREVRTLAQIQHPNIVQALEAGIEDDVCFFTMMFIPGKDLMSRLETELRFTQEESLKIIRTVADALRYVWNKHKLIHRDIKPANIIVTPMGDVQLMDLGISKQVDSDVDASLTVPGMMVGSPHYISPEQARGRKDLDFRTDMYSLGATLYHLLTGVTPYQSDSGMGVIACHLTDPVPNPADMLDTIRLDVCNLVQKMMAKDREDRFDNWDDTIEEMDRILQDMGVDKDEKKLESPIDHGFDYIQKVFAMGSYSGGEGNRLKRVMRLVFVLVVMLIAFGYVVQRSVKLTKEKRVVELYEKGLEYSRMPLEFKNVKQAIITFEQVQRAKHPVYMKLAKQQAKDIFDRYLKQKRIRQENEQRYAWEKLKTEAYQFEKVHKFDEAIQFWKQYLNAGPLRRAFSKKIRNELNYLYRQKEKKEKGLLN